MAGKKPEIEFRNYAHGSMLVHCWPCIEEATTMEPGSTPAPLEAVTVHDGDAMCRIHALLAAGYSEEDI